MKQPTDPLEKMLEKERMYRSLRTKYPPKPRQIKINGSVEVKRKIHGVDVLMVFPNYVKQKDGKVRHYHATGVDTYTSPEFQCIIEDHVNYIRQGAGLAMQDYKDTLKIILSAQEKVLKEEGLLQEGQKLKDLLDQDVPGYEGLKVKDVLMTPDITIQDFVPRRYYFGEIPALGLTYINSGIIEIDPKARVLDHINGWPVILVHEMTHRNPKLQSYPILNKFDAELWASLPELVYEDMNHFLEHGYLRDIRKVAKILFNFDSDLAQTDMTSLDLMTGTELEKDDGHKKVREYIKKVSAISKAIRDVAFNQYIPEFYTHPLYFITLNEFLKDDNAAFKLMMYMNFEPTLLGGPERTRDFIQENEEVFEDLARNVIWNLKKGRRERLDDDELDRIKQGLEQRLKQMDPAQKKTLMQAAKRFGMAETGNIDDLIRFGMRLYKLGIVDYDPEEEVLK